MNCDNQFCIYWFDNQYSLIQISLDIQGSCQDCILVDIPEETLSFEREKMLRRLNARH